MILIDAGPLVALLDRDEPDHRACVETMRSLRDTLVTTWAVLAEAMYLLGEQIGWRAQESLWKLVLDGRLVVLHLDRPLAERACTLMSKYRDTPMDLADATLVAIAEQLGIIRVFTLDGDFGVYRAHGRKAFEVMPRRVDR
jgi:predicted nucleic acid-binding protein